MKPENVLSVWVYSYNGDLEFEFEINPDVHLSQPNHAQYSKNKDRPNFVKVSSQKIISILHQNMGKFDVCGAKGKGIIIGEVEIPFGTITKTIMVLSTLNDWKDWLENNHAL